MSRMIDADRLMEIIRPITIRRKERPMIGEEVIAIWDDGIDGAELYEVQKLVRCKDCKHRYDDGWLEPRWTCDFLKDMCLKDDDFCSYGERKGE